MTYKLLLALAMSVVALVGCEEGKPEVEYFSIHALCESEDAIPEQVQEFLDLGVDVNAKDDDGFTPLHAAAGHNVNPEVITVLLKAGADVNAKNSQGKTALDYAKDNEKLKGTQALKELEEATNP